MVVVAAKDRGSREKAEAAWTDHRSPFHMAVSLTRQEVAVVVDVNAVSILPAAEAADVGAGAMAADGVHGGVEFAPALLADIVPLLDHGGLIAEAS